MVLRIVSPDADDQNADWTKQSWDLPPYKSDHFNDLVHDLDHFRTTPVYQNAVEQGLIHDDEWMGDYVKDTPDGDAAFAAHAAGVVYVTPDGELLLLKRAERNTAYPGTWAFPAGRIDDGESAQEAAAREFSEETRRDCPDLEHLADVENDDGVNFTAFACTGPKFDPKLNREHTAYTWVRLTDLPKPLHPGVLKVLESAIRRDTPQGEPE